MTARYSSLSVRYNHNNAAAFLPFISIIIFQYVPPAIVRCYKYFRGIIAFYPWPPQMMKHQTKGSRTNGQLSKFADRCDAILQSSMFCYQIPNMRAGYILVELFTHQLAVCPLVILARQFVNCQVALEHT